MWRKKEVVEEASVLVAPQLIPVVKQPVAEPVAEDVHAELNKLEREEYLKVAASIGFANGHALYEKLLGFLEEAEIKMYPFARVERYLDDKYGKKLGEWDSSQTWGWRALREVDMLALRDLKMDRWSVPIFSLDGRASNGNIFFYYGGAYSGRVPRHVLDVVKKISDAVPEVSFFVSDAPRAEDRVRVSDPFLLVLVPKSFQMLVVEKWDEPKF